MRRRSETNHQNWTPIALVGALLVAAFALYAAHILFDLGGAGTNEVFDQWIYLAVLFAAGALCVVRAIRFEDARLGWGLVGLALLVFAAGDLYWTEVLEGRAGEITFPSIADIGYLAYFPFAFAGTVLIVRDRLRNRPAGLWLDAAAVALAIASIGSAIVIEAVSEGLGGGAGAFVEGLIYPISDLLLISFLGAILVVSGQRPGPSVGLLVAGLAAIAVADAAYSYQVSQGTYSATGAINLLWPLAGLLVAAGAWAPTAPPVRIPTDRGWRTLVVSGVVGVAAVAGFAYEAVGEADPLTEALFVLTILAVLARLAYAFVENQRLLDRVSHDTLTGLANRGQLELDLREAIWHGEGKSILALLDLDGFKRYNDTFGHPAGDALLSRLAARLSAEVGASGTAYRVGGDEFCVLVEGDDADALIAVSRAEAAFSEAGPGFEISCSVGTVELPGEAPGPEAAIQLADRRMYANKASSRLTASEQAFAVLSSAQRERTPELSNHTRDVAELSVAVGRHLGLDAFQLALTARAAELHDIGKVAIPDAILDKPSSLTDTERAFVQRHSVIGERILASAPDLLPVSRIVRSSHERYDGGGYPDGLAGEDIPIAARIIFVCDAFCAMTTPRAYSPAITPRAALIELRRCAGTQFDPDVVKAFGQALAHGGPELAAEDAPARGRPVFG
jgi:diguanylate cyclase (GGDEF)-like protein